jgi:hypothetical protein
MTTTTLNTSRHAKIADLLAVPGIEGIELPILRNIDLAQAADLSVDPAGVPLLNPSDDRPAS